MTWLRNNLLVRLAHHRRDTNRQKRKPQEEESWNPEALEHQGGIVDPYSGVIERLWLNEMIVQAGLTPRESRVVELLRRDHSVAEIAEILGKSRQDVNQAKISARKKLRKVAGDSV